MSARKLHKREQQGACMTDDQEWISSWLRNADYREYGDDVNEIGDTTTIEPVTPPPRRLHSLLQFDEVSPTSTNFSGDTIFDIPEEPDDPRNEDPFRDDVSNVTSVAHDNKYREIKTKQCSPIVGPDVPTPEHIVESSRPASVVSYDPPSELDEDFEDELGDYVEEPVAPQAPDIDPDKPRIVWLTSCLQCTLAGLPCSRTTPACSRCKRAGKGQSCLLYRRKFREEIERSDFQNCTIPVLLKLKEEDPIKWQDKLSLAEELHTTWLSKQDRENWVLPSVCGRRGNFRDDGCRVPKVHPGEGWGRLTYRELHVDMEL